MGLSLIFYAVGVGVCVVASGVKRGVLCYDQLFSGVRSGRYGCGRVAFYRAVFDENLIEFICGCRNSFFIHSLFLGFCWRGEFLNFCKGAGSGFAAVHTVCVRIPIGFFNRYFGIVNAVLASDCRAKDYYVLRNIAFNFLYSHALRRAKNVGFGGIFGFVARF